MAFSTLTLLILVAYLLLLFAALAFWALLTLRKVQEAPEPPAVRPFTAPRPSVRQVSNDEMRGARAKVRTRQLEPGPKELSDQDAFEQFSQAKRDDLTFR